MPTISFLFNKKTQKTRSNALLSPLAPTLLFDLCAFDAILFLATLLGAYWFRSGERIGGGMPRIVRWPR
jgi:hypothetical protein